MIILQNKSGDKTSQLESVALGIKNGSMKDNKIPGLAHLIEHMMLLKNTKYPKKGEFLELIKANNGDYDASTIKDFTNYFYTIKKEQFLKSIDIFLHFFISPIFDSKLIKKEINSVDSEFLHNIHLEHKRFHRLFEIMANPKHPFSSFSTGNKFTLNLETHKKSFDLMKEIKKFFKRNYLSKHINLIIYTSLELEEIEKALFENLIKINSFDFYALKENFIKNNSIGKNENTFIVEPFSNKEKGKLIFYESKIKSLKIIFHLSDLKKISSTDNPLIYFDYLFNLIYKNSLYHNLLKEKLIIDYYCNQNIKNIDVNRISFEFSLTQKGLNEIQNIIKLTLDYIHKIKTELIDERVYNIIKNKKNNNFLHGKNDENSFQRLKIYINNFLLFGKTRIFSSTKTLGDFNSKVLNEIINQFKLENSQIYIGSPSFENYEESNFYKFLNINEEKDSNKINVDKSYLAIENKKSEFFLNKQEAYFDIKYKDYKLTNENLQLFKNNELLDFFVLELPNIKELSVTRENAENGICWSEIIAKKLSEKDCLKLYQNDNLNTNPDLITKTEKTSIYLKTDRNHLRNSFIINTKILPNEIIFKISEAKDVVLLKLLLVHFNNIYSELLVENEDKNNIILKFKDNFFSDIPQLSSRFTDLEINQYDLNTDGIYFQIQSPDFISINESVIFETIKNIFESKIDIEYFNFAKEVLNRNLQFYITSNPSYQAYNWFYRLGFKYDINHFNLPSILKEITIEDLIEFKNKIFNKEKNIENIYLLILGVGSIDKEKLLEYSKKIQDLIYKSFKNLNLDSELTSSNSYFLSNKKQKIKHQTQSFMDFSNLNSRKANKFIFQKKNFFDISSSASTLNAYYVGENNLFNNLKTKLVHLIIGNFFFDELRVKQQLGYLVFNEYLSINKKIFYFVHVQGNKMSPTFVREKIDIAFNSIEEKIKNLSELEFERKKEIILSKVDFLPKDLINKNDLYLSQFLGYENILDRNSVNQVLNSIKKEALVEFLQNMLKNELSIQVKFIVNL